jgi:hypothetical protein
VSNIIRRYIDHMKFVAYMFFLSFFRVLLVPFFTIVYMVVCFACFRLILKMMYFYYFFFFLFLCLCIFIVMFMYFYCYVYSVLYILFSLCCSVYCV